MLELSKSKGVIIASSEAAEVVGRALFADLLADVGELNPPAIDNLSLMFASPEGSSSNASTGLPIMLN